MCNINTCYCISTLDNCSTSETENVLIINENDVYVDVTNIYVLICLLTILCVFQNLRVLARQ